MIMLTTLTALAFSSSDRVAVSDFLNVDLARVVDWCESWDRKVNQLMLKLMVVIRSRYLLPVHPPLKVNGVVIKEEKSLNVYEKPIHEKPALCLKLTNISSQTIFTFRQTASL